MTTQNPFEAHIQELDGRIHRQYLDISSHFKALKLYRNQLAKYAGSLTWRRKAGGDYLYRAIRNKPLENLGVCSDETEAIYVSFYAEKEELKQRVAAGENELSIQRKINKIYGVGRAPEELVSRFGKMGRTGNQAEMTVDLRGIYAYEAAMGCHILFDRADYAELMEEKSLVPYVYVAGVCEDIDFFSAVIVSKNGHMAEMITVTPQAMAKLVRAYAEQSGIGRVQRDRFLFLADLIGYIGNEWFLPLNGNE